MDLTKRLFINVVPGDTFLDMSSLGKGFVYVHCHDLGRFWNIGPQQTLYLPGCWLREGENEVLVFDILGPANNVLSGLDAPILDSLLATSNNSDRNSLQSLRQPAGEPLIVAQLPQANGWYEAKTGASAKGRYLWLVAAPGKDSDATSIAEIQLTDSEGNIIPRENWKVLAVTGEDTESGNHTAEKAFDLQESTYWRCGIPNTLSSENPLSISDSNVMVIDLGKEFEVGGLHILPRMESGAPEAPASIKIYVIE